MSIDKPKVFISIIVVLVTFLSFLNRGDRDLQEWDESRNGVNAYEMLHNKDYVNYYYNNELDTWNAKPPLMIWLIVGSYKIFGFNEFALRFPSLVCTIIFFMLCFYTIKLLENERLAFLTCLILISGKAILGTHIGLTGDFDALLIVFLTASVYSFILYLEKDKKHAIYFVALFTALAFYTKGPASLVFIPGFALYAAFRNKVIGLLRDAKFWLSAAIFILIAGSWFLLVYKYSKISAHSVYGSNNSIETMLIHDTFRRLTSSDFEHAGPGNRNLMFFFATIDSRLNLWNYLFVLSLIVGLFSLYKNRSNIFGFINTEPNRMTLLSFSLITPLSVVLTFALNQHNWYLAPAFMFISFLTAKGILILNEKWKPFYLVVGAMLIFTFTRNCYFIYSQPTTLHNYFTNNRQLQNKKIFILTGLRQDLLLYLKWLNVLIVQIDPENMTEQRGEIILVDNKKTSKYFLDKVVPLQNFDHYCLGIIK